MTKISNKITKKPIIFIFIVFIIIFASFIALFLLTQQNPAFAQYGLEQAERIEGLAKGTIPEYVGGIINAVVGILGVILVALIIYGGVMYMTSAGSEEKIKSAKNILTYAIIGVVIVFASYIIAKFVLQAVGTQSTTETVGGEKESIQDYNKASERKAKPEKIR